MCAKAITLDQLPAELRRLDGAFRDAAIKGLQRAAYDLHAEAVRQVGAVEPRVPVATGAMREKFRVTALPDGAAVENPVPYAAHMEFGTRPHWAPISALRTWARIKLRGRGKVAKGYKGPVRKMLAQHKEDEIESLAKRAQRSIAKRGIEARGFWRAALAKAPGFVDKRVRAAIRAVR